MYSVPLISAQSHVSQAAVQDTLLPTTDAAFMWNVDQNNTSSACRLQVLACKNTVELFKGAGDDHKEAAV